MALPSTRLDLVYRNQVLLVRDRVLAYTGRKWAGLGAYRDADYERFVADIVPRVEAGQQRIADLTDAYIRRLSEIELKQSLGSVKVLTATTHELRGVDAATVYQRPFKTVYLKLSEGRSLDEAVSAGGARLTDIVGTGLQLAKTHTARDVIDRSGFIAHRRVLTGREHTICVAASTQAYARGDLMPIHPGCDCDNRPYSGHDVQAVDADLTARAKAAVAEKFGTQVADGSNYRNLIVSNEHSEIGPILGWRSQHFAGPEVLT